MYGRRMSAMSKVKQIIFYKGGVRFEANSDGFILTSVNGNKVVFDKKGEMCKTSSDVEKKSNT